MTKAYNYVRATGTVNGRRYEASGKTRREAERKLARKLEAVRRGEIGSSGDLRVSAWADEWLNTYVRPRVRQPGAPKQPRTMSPKSFRTYESAVRLYIKPAVGNKRLSEVTEPDLRRILNAERDMSYSHVHQIRLVIKAMFRQAYVSRLITYDPALALELPATVKGTRRSLTAEEKEVFFRVAESHRHGNLFRFLLATGLRPNEVRALRVRHLDLDRGIVRVEDAVESGSRTVAAPKTAAGVRHTVINDAPLRAWLVGYIRDKSPDDFLFPQVKHPDRMMSDSVIHSYWRSFAYAMDIAMGAETVHGHIPDPKDKKADGTPLYPDPADPSKPRNGHRLAPDIDLYCLRHTFGTDMQRLGVPVEVTKYLMGHADIATTSNIYIDSGEPEAIRATKYLSSASSPVGKTWEIFSEGQKTL